MKKIGFFAIDGKEACAGSDAIFYIDCRWSDHTIKLEAKEILADRQKINPNLNGVNEIFIYLSRLSGSPAYKLKLI